MIQGREALLLYIIFFLSSLSFANVPSECPQTDSNYIIGNYSLCASSQEGNSSIRCRYLKALCAMAESSYEKSRYELSLISADIGNGDFGEINGLALASLAEIAFLQGDHGKGRTLSSAVSDVLGKKLPASYPHSVSEVLMAKSSFEFRDLIQAESRLENMRKLKVDSLLFSSLDPWQ